MPKETAIRGFRMRQKLLIQLETFLRVDLFTVNSLDIGFRNTPLPEDGQMPLCEFQTGFEQHAVIAVENVCRQYHTRPQLIQIEFPHGTFSSRLDYSALR